MIAIGLIAAVIGWLFYMRAALVRANDAARQAKHRAKIAEAAGERERQGRFVAGKVWGR